VSQCEGKDSIIRHTKDCRAIKKIDTITTLLEAARARNLCVYDLNHKSTIHAIDLTAIAVVCFPTDIFLSFSLFLPLCILRRFLISADGLLTFLYPSVQLSTD
jgi:hypothetical protein